jgi:hypothetical protein
MMEQTTQRWVVILGVVVVVYLALVLSHAVLGVKVVPW